MSEFLANPLVQSVLIPVLGGFILTGAIRFANGASKGPLVAGAAVALGFLIAYCLIVGLPPVPPVSAQQKLAFVVAAGLVIGFLLDFFRRPPFYRELIFVVGMAAALYWIAEPKVASGTAWTYLGLVALWLASGIVGFRLERSRSAALESCVMLLVAALGLGVISQFGRSASLAQLSFGLATALGGFMLWNWPINRYPFGAALLLGAGGALIATMFVLVLYTESSPIPVAMLLLCFFADLAAKRVKLPSGKIGEALKPIVLGGIALTPVLAAAAVGYVLSGYGDSTAF